MVLLIVPRVTKCGSTQKYWAFLTNYYIYYLEYNFANCSSPFNILGLSSIRLYGSCEFSVFDGYVQLQKTVM